MYERHSWRVLTIILIVGLLAGLLSIGIQGNVRAASIQDKALEEFQTAGLCVDDQPYRVEVAGVGMYNQTSGIINLSLPPTATVYKAYLYWTGRDPFDGGDRTVQFSNGSTTVTIYAADTGVNRQIAGPAFWGTNDFAYAYRADVTSYVDPTISTYTFIDPFGLTDPDDFDVAAYGAALVVIYQDSAGTWPNIVGLWEGMDIAQGSSAPAGSEGITPVIIQFDPAAVDRTMYLSTVVGGVFPGTDAKVYYQVGSGLPPSGDIYGTGTPLILPPSNTSPYGDGNFMTTFDFDITVPAGSTWVAVQVKSEDTNGPQLHWIAQTYEMEAACPRLEVRKVLDEPADGVTQVGDTVTFQIEVENTGNTTLEVVPLTDTYDPTYLQYSGVATPSPDTSSSGQLEWSDITNSLGDLGPGDVATVSVSFTAKASTQDLAGDVTTNTASVSGATDENDNTPPDDSDSDTVEISNPSISIEKTLVLPQPPDFIATVGETVQFTITVTNTGDTVLTTVPLTDTYDTSYLSFQNASPYPDRLNPGAGELKWTNIGPLNPNESTTITVTFQAVGSTWNGRDHDKTHNRADVSATDENGDTVGPEEDTAWVKVTQPAVTITKTLLDPDAHAPVNSQVTYRIVVENSGDTVLDVVPVRDTFPTAYLDYASDTLSSDPNITVTVDESGGTIEWDDVTGSGPLAPGASIQFDVVFDVTASSNPNTITNTICVESATDVNDDSPDDVCDDDSTLITTNPHLSISKTRTTDSPVRVGDAVEFEIVITNDGDTAITSLPLTDTFDDTKLNFVDATPDESSWVGGTITWNDLTTSLGDGKLDPGESIVITVQFTAAASTTPGTTTNTATVSGAEDEHGDTVPTAEDSDDVAIVTPASVGDYVWEDTNGNGIQDAGENGVEGVTVKLYTAGGTLVGTDTTDTNGEYGFTHLFPGDYYLVFEPPSDYAFTAQDQGNDAEDSDANPATGQTDVFTLGEGQNDDTRDAGLYRPVALGDYVWEDMNGDGIQNDGATGIQDVTVELYYAGPDGTFDSSDLSTPYQTTTTDSNGNYSFTNLPPGKYILKFIPETGTDYVLTFQDQGDDALDSDADRTTGMTAEITLNSGDGTDDTWDAGMYIPVTIGDWVWQDSDAQGDQDDSEPGLDGVTLELVDGSGNHVAYATTAGGGFYQFTDLPPGTYKVIAPDTYGNYVSTTPTVWGPETLQSGATRDDADFGYISPTAVELLDFQAEVNEAGVHLTWRTRSEENVTGFWVQRATVRFGPWQNVLYVPAQGSGATYTAYDARVQPGFTYYYRLVTVPEGQTFGPWVVYVPKSWEPGAGIQSSHQVFMPMLWR